ncbi:hypothetical protein B0H34DRAFT_721205 [Crassisporium funariophilum]|nr:hypothetical protein B0H34DRAFT_721205 [Crassisporium funariophilum]
MASPQGHQSIFKFAKTDNLSRDSRYNKNRESVAVLSSHACEEGIEVRFSRSRHNIKTGITEKDMNLIILEHGSMQIKGRGETKLVARLLTKK